MMNPAVIQPVVLVGGRARRFGRDKLAEPFHGSMGGELLVDQPLRALRLATRSPVWTVGDASTLVRSRGDGHVDDHWPGSGPLGGILSTLLEARADVLVLAGDLPCITDAEVSRLLGHAAMKPGHQAVIARTDGPEPCIGIYRRSVIETLERRRSAGDMSLLAALTDMNVEFLDLPRAACLNANHPDDLAPFIRARPAPVA